MITANAVRVSSLPINGMDYANRIASDDYRQTRGDISVKPFPSTPAGSGKGADRRSADPPPPPSDPSPSSFGRGMARDKLENSKTPAPIAPAFEFIRRGTGLVARRSSTSGYEISYITGSGRGRGEGARSKLFNTARRTLFTVLFSRASAIRCGIVCGIRYLCGLR